MTGWEVVKDLRADPELRSLRVLVVSANAHEYAPGSSDAPHDGFVMKPVDAAVLFAAVQGQLHLEWIYGSDPAANEAGLAIGPELREKIATHLEDLWQLGLIGHVARHPVAAARVRIRRATGAGAGPGIAGDGGTLRHETLHGDDQGAA